MSADLGDALHDLLPAGPHPDPVGAVRSRSRRRARARGGLLATTAVLAVVAVAVGPQLLRPMQGSSAPVAAGPQLWTGRSYVIQAVGRVPMLCAGVAQSLPPQCGGIPLRGLGDPAALPSATTLNGVVFTDEELQVTGSWDGAALTVTQKPVLAGPRPSDPVDFTSPCPDPVGGWRYDRWTQAGLEQAIAYARSQPDAGAPWVGADQRLLNLTFTGDLDRHRREVAAVYQGPVCVSSTTRSAASVRALQDRFREVAAAHGLQALSFGNHGLGDDYLEATVLVATDAQLAELEREFGPILRVSSFLTPLPR